jgi:hypothetical protein
MTSPPTEYFHVCENRVEDNEFDIDRFIDLLCDYYHDLDIVNFGKFSVPVERVSSVSEFLLSTVPSLRNYEFFELSDSFFLCKVRDLYFHITWSVVDGFYVFPILHGNDVARVDTEVYVFHGNEDAATVVPLDYRSDRDDDFE